MAERKSSNVYLEECNKIRGLICEFIAKREKTTSRQLAQVFNISEPQIRNYLKYLMDMGNIERRGGTKQYSYYVATGRPYVSTWPRKTVEVQRKEMEENKPTGARIIRLLDRKPHEISLDEKMERRRQGRASLSLGERGSSMSMFEAW